MIYIDSQGMAWIDVQDLGKNKMEGLTKEMEKRYVGQVHVRAQSVKIFVFHGNDCQRSSIMKVVFKNHLEKVTCSVDANQQLSQATSVLAHWTYE